IEIGSLTFTPNLVDSVNVGGIMQLPQLRIRLTDEFALQIINADANVFDDNESWLAFMKGIYITADNAAAGGGIMLFDMFSTLTNLTIFYRTGDPQDTLSFSFLSNSNCARFTSFDHNSYSEASAGLQAQILNDDTAGGQQQIYLQGMGGVKAQIRLPDIESFFENGPVSINEAKLIFNIYDDGAELDAPPQLALAIIDEDGKYLPLPDANEVSSYFGGYLNEGKTQYFFRISRHVQQVLTGASPNYPLALLVSGASFRPQRTILYGPHQQNAELRMRLAVKYTKVN
ncbi:MAG TPA: DUF4270 family protein, partial [Bacteroidales bacterium]|nr:DUF4270 family protein [Bacteroidales bacterium]